jgi:hypothetical protein
MPRRRLLESLFGFDLLQRLAGNRPTGGPTARRARRDRLDDRLGRCTAGRGFNPLQTCAADDRLEIFLSRGWLSAGRGRSRCDGVGRRYRCNVRCGFGDDTWRWRLAWRWPPRVSNSWRRLGTGDGRRERLYWRRSRRRLCTYRRDRVRRR